MIIAIAAFVLAAQAVRTPPPQSDAKSARDRCVSFASERLLADRSFRRPIGGGLEFRLSAEPGAPGRWHVTVGPASSTDDYLWVVSPPFRTAPHVQVGAGYNLTAIQSAQMSPRHFRFVTSRAEYADAAAFADRATRDANAGITVEDIERKGRGTLVLWITAFRANPSGDSLAWVRVRARACRPR
jgi:hypothetical protein